MPSTPLVPLAAATLVALAAIPAAAGPVTAAVRVFHDDYNGMIFGGESINFTVLVSWEPAASFQFAGLRGDTRATPDLGVASNLQSTFFTPGPFQKLGTPTNGSIIDTDIAVFPAGMVGSVHPGTTNHTGMQLITFTWTAPDVSSPVVVGFDFVPYAIAPNARFYTGLTISDWVEADTFYLGTSILVVPIPAPSSAALLLILPLVAPRRRRETTHAARAS